MPKNFGRLDADFAVLLMGVLRASPTKLSFLRSFRLAILLVSPALPASQGASTQTEVKARAHPDILKTWQGWALWDDGARFDSLPPSPSAPPPGLM